MTTLSTSSSWPPIYILITFLGKPSRPHSAWQAAGKTHRALWQRWRGQTCWSAKQQQAASLGNLPSRASPDSSTPPTPASPHTPSMLPLSSPHPSQPTDAVPSAQPDTVPSPMSSSPSPKPGRSLLYFLGTYIKTLALPLMSCSLRVLGHSCSFQAFSFLLSLFKNIILN